MTDPLVREIALACPPERAFRAFTEHVDLWWPRSHRRYGPDSRLTLETAVGGRLVERGPQGDWTMATVVAIDPPHRLVLDWFPGSPTAPTRVEITFAASESGTLVTIMHTAPTAASASAWPDRVALFTTGWDAVLPALKAHTEEEVTHG